MIDDAHRIGWLRGFFDGEGSACFSANGRWLDFANTDPTLIAQTCEYLAALGIECTAYRTERRPPRKPVTHVRIGRRDSVTKFIKLVGSSMPAKRKVMAMLLRWYRRPGQKRRNRWGGPPIPATEEMKTLQSQGMSVRDMAAHFNIKFNTMAFYVRKAGLGKYRHRRGPEPSVAEVRAAYIDEGLSLLQLGTRFNYRDKGMWRYLKRHGIRRRRPGRRTRKQDGALLPFQ